MRLLGLLCTIFLLTAAPVRAQETAAPPPAHIAFVEGTATIEHDGQIEAAVLNMPVLEGDRIRTTDGRVEVLFADRSSVAIDPGSDVEFLGGTHVRVVAGAIEHRAAADTASGSAQYLPSDLQPYGRDFDQYGSWQYDAAYGNVWYPTVAADWRPYYYGYWTSIHPYGWTWIGYDRWAWPTHHYGRWGYARQRWFWIPGRTWGAAWVSWGTAPDYISWCPLGYDNRPVVALSIGFNSYHRGWNAWTIVPRDRFGVRGYSAHRYAIAPYRLASTTPFLFHRSAPRIDGRRDGYGVSSNVAVPRYGRRDGVDVLGGASRGRFPGRDAGDRRWTNPSERQSGTVNRRLDADTRVVLPGTPPTAVNRDLRDLRDPRDLRDSRDLGSDRRGDSRDFRPRYQPRFEAPGGYAVPQVQRRPAAPPNPSVPRSYAVPLAEPRVAAPPAASGPRSYSNPRAQPRAAAPVTPMAEWRPTAPMRQAPATPMPAWRPAPARPAPGAGPAGHAGAPARAPHAGRSGGAHQADTAVRRPR